MTTITAHALANVALVKYFGKRDLKLNLPETGSLSLTLAPLSTTTTVTLDPELTGDEVFLDGRPADQQFRARVSKFLDLVRTMADRSDKARVETSNDFPTAAGLASSASGFAALTLAATRALGLELDRFALSALARRGSGSAARSTDGGIVVWWPGQKSDGSDSFAHTIAEPDAWDLRVVIGITEAGPKAIGSTEAMEHTRINSPYYDPWIETTHCDLEDAIDAVRARDLEALGSIAERSALKMHAAALAANPGIVFWRGPTIEALHLVRSLRAEGRNTYFTCDAGPQPKVLCAPSDEDTVAEALSTLPGVNEVIRCRLGGGAAVVE